MTEDAITVLVVTADRDFAADCESQLSANADISVVVAKAVGDAAERLTTGHRIDCIVSDHDLPDTDGVAFLQAVRAHAPTLPFILFTSEGSERVASRAISANVTDYLVKEHHGDQWDRLVTLVTDAVSYYRDQRGLVDTDSRARALLDASNDLIAVVRDGRFEYVNGTGVELLGAENRAAVAGQEVSQWVSTVDDAALTDQLAAVQAGDRSLDHIEARLVCADGVAVPVELMATRIEWADSPAVVLVARDVSDRRERERSLALKNRAIDEAPIGITIADADGADNPLVYVNGEFQRMSGYAKAEVIGRNPRFLQGADTDPEAVAEMREAIAADEPVTVELRNYRKDGSEFWNRVTVAPIVDDTGKVTHYVGFQEDVTERKESEDMLRRFRRAVEAAGHAIYMADPDGTITHVNPAFERITGHDSEDAVGQTPRILNSGEMSEDYYEKLWKTISAGDVWEEEIRDRRRSGELYYAHQTIAPLTDGDGDVEAYVAIQTDITEQKEREAQLRQYEHAIEGANDLIAAVDREYRYLFANEAYREFHDLDPDSMRGRSLPESIGREAFGDIEAHVERAFAGQTVRYRMTRSRPVRPDRTFDIRYYPLTDGEDEVWGVVATMRDRTDEVERERQLASLDRLLRHNLRNELNVIQGRAETVRRRAPDDVAELAVPIEDAADRILEQSDSVREIVQLLSDPTAPTTVDLAALVSRATDRVNAEYPDAAVAVDVSPGVEVTTVPELERAVYELVENAVVHSDQEAPEVTVRTRRRHEWVEIDIVDDGPGIPPQERKVIGEDSEIDSLLHSNGMELWLVKRIVTRANGTLRFEDRNPRGSIVTIALPRTDGSDETHPDTRREPSLRGGDGDSDDDGRVDLPHEAESK